MLSGKDAHGSRAKPSTVFADFGRGDWDWSPRQERWTPRCGYPPTAAYISMSTGDFADANPYEAWRHHAYYAFDADPLPKERAHHFAASVQGLLNTNGEFFSYTSHAVSGRGWPGAADRDGGDALSLGLVVEGERRGRGEGDAVHIARGGDFFLFDPRHWTEFSWTRHRAMHVMLRRPAVEHALGDVPLNPGAMLRALTQSPMMPLLRDQFLSVARNMTRLDSRERSFMLDQTIRLALFACGQTGEREEDGLFVAAMRIIERRLSHPALSPQMLAHSLGVSRATLYRAFAARDLAVAEAIRDARLDRARDILIGGTTMRISDAALASGWLDTANFARAFRARFGIPPSALRETV